MLLPNHNLDTCTVSALVFGAELVLRKKLTNNLTFKNIPDLQILILIRLCMRIARENKLKVIKIKCNLRGPTLVRGILSVNVILLKNRLDLLLLLGGILLVNVILLRYRLGLHLLLKKSRMKRPIYRQVLDLEGMQTLIS